MEISSVTDNRVLKPNQPLAELPQKEAPKELVDSKAQDFNIAGIFDTDEVKSKVKQAESKNFWVQNVVPNWDDKNTAYENIKLNYPHWFNVTTVGLHALGSTLPSIPFIPKSISLGFRKAAESFSRWCVPFSKIHNCIEALQGKRLYEAIARTPALLIPLLKLPFHNFQLVYGLGSGINVVHETIKSRIGELKAEDGFAVNNKKVQDGFLTAVNDLVKGGDHVKTKERARLGLTLVGGAAMLFGAVPTLLFDRNGLNDGFARIFGSVRSLGGLLGDLSITLFPKHEIPELQKKLPVIGSFYLIPTFMDFAQRWMKQSDETNEIFNHVKTTLNTVAELIWTHFSTIENQKAKEKSLLKTNTPAPQRNNWTKQVHSQEALAA